MTSWGDDEEDICVRHRGRLHRGSLPKRGLKIATGEFRVGRCYPKAMRSDGPRWEHFEHQADMGIRGWGRTRDEAFAQAALALVAVSVDPAQVARRERVQISCEADDPEMLLYEWLNAVVYQMATRKMVFGQFSVASAGTQLQGEMLGEALEVGRHQPAVEVKAATVTCLRVAREPDGAWTAQCVVDV